MDKDKINDVIGNEVYGVREYNPDKWMVFKMNEETNKDYRVLAGWKGGFADPDYWKINSGVKSVERDGNKFIINGFSGSKYIVYEDNYGYTTLTSGIMNSIMEQLPNTRILTLEDFMVEW